MDILQLLLYEEMNNLSMILKEKIFSEKIEEIDIGRWHRVFKLLYYAFCGCGGILLDEVIKIQVTKKFAEYYPNVIVTWHLINKATGKSVGILR